MNDDNDDFNPDVESILEYCARRAQEGRRMHLPHAAPLASVIGPGTAIEIQTALQELLEVQAQTVSVDDFIVCLRSVASRLDQEADRLHARGAINFHVCPILQ